MYLFPLTAARGRRAVGSEAGARDLSDQLPFLEYELHKLLLAKLRMQVIIIKTIFCNTIVDNCGAAAQACDCKHDRLWVRFSLRNK